jgi:hypothetical protein
MRKGLIWLSLLLIYEASGIPARANAVKVCVSQNDEGNDALRLARELSSRKLGSGVPLTVVAITGKALSSREEEKLADPSTPFVRVLLTQKGAKVRGAEIEGFGCEYMIEVTHHEGADNFDAVQTGIPKSSPETASPGPGGDPETVGYELRKAGSKKVIARAIAPPLTVFVRQGRRVFNPYVLFADQIMKKINTVS